ncbi:MAG: hypothetical protein HY585_04030 [Candidatus Omnitrophica bacterium]|nr:hypothetical protein [Candidatus Omnitrophota bacterium]
MKDEQKLSIRGLAIAGGIFWGASVFLVGVLNLIAPTYGLSFLWFASSVYPGYKADPTLVSVLIGTAYAAADGFVSGAALAWLYNIFSSIGKK